MRTEPPWEAKIALTELDGKPVIAFSSWARWQTALGIPAVQFAYAKNAQPSGLQDWALAPSTDAKLSTNGRESVYRIALYSDADNLYYGMHAHYTRPDGRLLCEGFILGRAYPPGSKQSDFSREVSGRLDTDLWTTQSVILSSVPLFSYIACHDINHRSYNILRVTSSVGDAFSTASKWRTDEIDKAVPISSVALALAGDTILACYAAQESAAAGKSGLVLQQGRRQAAGAITWRVLRVLLPGNVPTGEMQLLAGAGRVYLFCGTESGLVMASCAADKLETQSEWSMGVIIEGTRLEACSAVMLDGLPAVLSQQQGCKFFSIAKSATPQYPQDWSCIRFTTCLKAQAALAVINGTPAIAYQSETPRAIGYAWTDQAQPRKAADWHKGLVFREASIRGPVNDPYSRPIDNDKTELERPSNESSMLMAGPPPSPWRAEAPVPPGSAAKRNIYWMLAAALAILLSAGIAAFFLRRMLRR
jgi:hypothetical protein